MSHQPPVKILAFPIFRRYWLYHAWEEPGAAAAAAKSIKDWRKGVNLEEKLDLLGQQASAKVSIHHSTVQSRIIKVIQRQELVI